MESTNLQNRIVSKLKSLYPGYEIKAYINNEKKNVLIFFINPNDAKQFYTFYIEKSLNPNGSPTQKRIIFTESKNGIPLPSIRSSSNGIDIMDFSKIIETDANGRTFIENYVQLPPIVMEGGKKKRSTKKKSTTTKKKKTSTKKKSTKKTSKK